MAGEIQRALVCGDYELAKSTALKYKNVFNEDYYLEYQSHSDETQQSLNRMIVDLANDISVKYVVTTDAHYLNKEDQKYHNIFVQIGQAREVGETYNDCYVQSNDEILKICKSTTKEENLAALRTSDEIADKCNVIMPLSPPIMPHIEIPDGYKSEIDYLKDLCINGWFNKKINLKPNKEEYKKRLAYEMNAIEKMGFEGYFLLVHSYCNSVKRRGIARGSAGGSLVCYLSNITDIDPLEYGLYFERFIDVGALELLNEGKITKNELKIPD
jgi:DNA polymerase-3 subunit alpha